MLLFFSLAFHFEQFFFSLLMLKVKVHAVVKAADIHAVAYEDRFNVILMLPLCECKTKITHKKEKKYIATSDRQKVATVRFHLLIAPARSTSNIYLYTTEHHHHHQIIRLLILFAPLGSGCGCSNAA